MSAEKEWTTEACRNCGDGSSGRFCPACGQRKGEVRVSLRRMLADVLEDQLSIDATLPRTLVAILFRPGRLTNEYMKGRIASWIPPFRLYLAASVIFFLSLSLQNRATELAGAVDEAGIPADTILSLPVSAVIDSLTAAAAEATGTAPAEQAVTAPEDTASANREPASRPGFLGITIEDAVEGDDTPWTDRVVVQTGNERLNRLVLSRFEELSDLPADEAISRILGGTLDRVPTAMFVLLPLFALLLKLLYVRSGRFYVEHFVFALHYHAFAFLSFTLMLVPGVAPLSPVLWLWLFVYLWLALKRVYGQGIVWTSLKWLSLTWSYLFLLSVGLGLTLVAAVLLL